MRRLVSLLLGCVSLAASLAAAGAGGAAQPLAPLPAPQWVGGNDVHGKAQLTWVRSAAFSSVRIYRREEGPETVFLRLAETRENSWLDETVQLGRTYRYRLAGVGEDGREGRPSSELAVRIGVLRLRPPVPPEWDGYLPLGDGVGLKWAAREGEDVIAWNVYRREPPATEFQLVGSTRGTSYRDTGLLPGRRYVYVLTALDSSFRETAYSQELAVTFAAPAAPARAAPAEQRRVRRARVVALVDGGRDLRFVRPADVAVGPVTGRVYVADSGRNLVFVFSPQGVFQRVLGAGAGDTGIFRNILGLATDAAENLYVVDAGAGTVSSFSPEGNLRRRVELPPRAGPTGLIDAVVHSDGTVYVVDNFNSRVSVVRPEGVAQDLGRLGAAPGEFSAPTFCALDVAGSLYVADGLNARVQVFSAAGEFVRAFGRADRAFGGFGRPKGVAVSSSGEVYVADSWLNTVQVFDGEGRPVAVLGDEKGRLLDLGSPNGIALGPGNRVYVAERLAARLQVLELIDVP